MKKWMMVLFIALCSVSAMCGDICEDINDLANDWNDVANFVNEVESDVLSESDMKTLERYVTDLAEDTYHLADALIDLGNKRETQLGTQMRKTMAKLTEANEDNVVQLLDQLVDIIDKTTDYCDE